MSNAWIDRRMPAVDRILDAAAGLFAASGVDGVGMMDIAAAAGCSRATLYRYFPDRAALQAAFVQREALSVARLVFADLSGLGRSPELVTEAVVSSLRHVRAAPALLAWFGEREAGRTAVMAQHSEVIDALGLAISPDPEADRWLTRIIVSLLTVPGRDDADERRMVERFVAPLVRLHHDP